jgi:uncharacterized circularly permuted ATP-grasp superfamily protein
MRHVRKAMIRHILSEEERTAIQADHDKLIVLRDRARKALKGASMNLSQRETCKKALPAIEEKIGKLKERLMADQLLRNCDEYNIPKHYQDRPRSL